MYCPDCRYQEEFCRCPIRRRDVAITLLVLAALLSYLVWASLHPRANSFPEEQGYQLAPPAVRSIPPPRPPSSRA